MRRMAGVVHGRMDGLGMRGLSRRELLRAGGAALGAVVLAGAVAPGLSGCTGREPSPASSGSAGPGDSSEVASTGNVGEGDTMSSVNGTDDTVVMLNSGFAMPRNGLGTYSLHGDTCVASVRAALASGVRLIDTASVYGNEEEVGRALRDAIEEGVVRREDVFVTTKIYPGSEMANPEPAIQACLDRLDIGYVDLMLLHHPDPNDVAAYQAMERFVRAGRIRSLGLSCYYIEELSDFLPQVETVPAVVQNEIHPYYQDQDVVPFIQEQGITVEAWYPLGGRPHAKEETLADPVIGEIAAAHGVSPAQVVLRWEQQRGIVVIPGSSNADHIVEDAQLYHFELTTDEMERIGELDRHEKHDWY